MARLARGSTEGAGPQPGASLQLANLAFCHGQRECVQIPTQGSPEAAVDYPSVWSFCLLEFLAQMVSKRDDDIEPNSNLAQGMGKNCSPGSVILLPLVI